MKLTEQQDIYLKEYLRKALKYRETYNEVYDHMLTALTNKTGDAPFEQIVDEIIRYDFGGRDSLAMLEVAAKKSNSKADIASFRSLFYQLL